MKKLMDIIFPSIDDNGMYAEFKDVYFAVSYVNPKEKSAKT